MGSCWGHSRTRRRRPSSRCCRRRRPQRLRPPRFPSTSRGCRPLLRRSRLMLWHRRWGRCTRWRAPRRPRRRSLQRPPPALLSFPVGRASSTHSPMASSIGAPASSRSKTRARSRGRSSSRRTSRWSRRGRCLHTRCRQFPPRVTGMLFFSRAANSNSAVAAVGEALPSSFSVESHPLFFVRCRPASVRRGEGMVSPAGAHCLAPPLSATDHREGAFAGRCCDYF